MKLTGRSKTWLIAAALAGGMVAGAAGTASALTVTIKDVAGTTVFGAINTDIGSLGDVVGWFDGAWNDTMAERFASGSNKYESDLVATASGLTSVKLGGTELAISGSTATVAANTYFTAKFGQSLAVFHNTLDDAIKVTFDKSVCTSSVSNQCGTISHYKAISDGSTPDTPDTPAVPLPAAGWLLIGAFGGLAAMRRKKSKA